MGLFEQLKAQAREDARRTTGLVDYVAEPLAMLGSAVVAEPVAGLGGLVTGDPGVINALREGLTYQPKTPEGLASLNALANALRSVKTTMVDENPPVRGALNAFNGASDWIGERNALAGALMRTAPLAAMAFAGPGSSVTRQAFGNVGRDAARSTNALAQMAARNAAHSPMPYGSLAAQRGSIGQEAKYVYPRDEAMDIARQNAVKMLGLPENNTATDRAIALGFDLDRGIYEPDWYHASKNNSISKFDPLLSGDIGTHFGDPKQADSIIRRMGSYPEGAAVYPVVIRDKNITKIDDVFSNPDYSFSDIADQFNLRGLKGAAKKADASVVGVDRREAGGQKAVLDFWAKARAAAEKQKTGGYVYQNEFEGSGGMSAAITDPTLIRSRFAAFDPARISDADILGAADPRLLRYLAMGSASPFIYEKVSNKKK